MAGRKKKKGRGEAAEEKVKKERKRKKKANNQTIKNKGTRALRNMTTKTTATINMMVAMKNTKIKNTKMTVIIKQRK